MASESVIEAIKKAREGSGKRNFKQSFDLAINLKSIDLKKAENKFKLEVALPKGSGKPERIGVFADTLIPQVKALGKENIILIRKDELEDYGRDKKAAKRLAKSCSCFIAEAPLMPMIGKLLGPVLAVRNKMPKPVPPTLPNIKPLIDRESGVVRISLKDSPVIHCRIGAEEMGDEDIAANAEAVIKGVIGKLPKGREQVKDQYIKLTMGIPVKFEVEKDGEGKRKAKA